jgi:hypothetical protein
MPGGEATLVSGWPGTPNRDEDGNNTGRDAAGRVGFPVKLSTANPAVVYQTLRDYCCGAGTGCGKAAGCGKGGAR